MNHNKLLQIAATFCLLASNLACAAMVDSGSTNAPMPVNRFASDQPNAGRINYSATATTRDGRRVYLANGTWEFAPNNGFAGQDLPAKLPNGRNVVLHSDGTWDYGRYIFNNSLGKNNLGNFRGAAPKPTPSPKPVLPSFLHIYQDDGGYGRATVYLNGDPVAHLREKRYFVIRVPPGVHMLDIAKRNQGTIRLTTAPGRHYYIKNSEGFEGWGERLKLMGPNEALPEIGRAKLISSADIIRYELFVEPQMSN